MVEKTEPTSSASVPRKDKRRRDALHKRNKAATHSGHIDDLPKNVAGEKIKTK